MRFAMAEKAAAGKYFASKGHGMQSGFLSTLPSQWIFRWQAMRTNPRYMNTGSPQQM